MHSHMYVFLHSKVNVKNVAKYLKYAEISKVQNVWIQNKFSINKLGWGLGRLHMNTVQAQLIHLNGSCQQKHF